MKEKKKCLIAFSLILILTCTFNVFAETAQPRNIDDFKYITMAGENYRIKFNVEPYMVSTGISNVVGLGNRHNLKVEMTVFKRDTSADVIYYDGKYSKSEYAVEIYVERTGTEHDPVSRMIGAYYVDGKKCGTEIEATPTMVIRY